MKRNPDDLTLDEIKEAFQKMYGYSREELDGWDWPPPGYIAEGVGHYTQAHFEKIAHHVALYVGSGEGKDDLINRLGGGQ